MKNTIKYECIKEITKALRKTFKGIQSNSYGFCCGSDYDAYHKYINDNDYICAKVYRGGLNNDYYNGKFNLGKKVYFMWHLTEFKLEDTLAVMQNVATNYGYEIIAPENEGKCITLVVKES